MKNLKKIFAVIAIIIAIPLVVALFVKKDYVVEREIIINKPKAEVFEYIKFLKNQDNYSKWNMMDPDMKKTYQGTDGTVGFISAWESKKENVGAGEQEIVNMIDGERIDTKLRFKVPFESQNDAYMITEDMSNNQTKVKWGFKGAFPYPFNLMGLFMDMEKAVGGDLEVGLQNLKNLLEK
ncbi:MAG: SRPBCC family protein [Saprospiraceae bacterium]|nr:SRPBCC family protein [Candidatus Parvibacillus calidus]MBX2938273.1 SRPBCC family protein [Saprospiraceae bacterium]MBX7179651.1 SRPBCC family protein [Saprospiraceae bacterium]MCB0590198.1 SRPBCC family protein [Saprospiraceae bacterium]MCO5282295.1 SRPBCC family protein [Saprospiraceae bacterium]